MKKLVVLSGAGISAESGIETFRDGDGLWNKYRMEELATPEAFRRNPELLLEFYNWRRKKVIEASPNEAHRALVRLEEKFKVTIITQNVDDLHERAGSTHVVHLHGEIMKARSTIDPELVYPLDKPELNIGDTCEKGSQLRPHIVWFGEPVPMIGVAARITEEADILMIIGTSLVVYPAAGLLHYAPGEIPKYYVDPKARPVSGIQNLKIVAETAGKGVPRVVDHLIAGRS
ncbi:MAG: NAD-dependent deacylase [Bacteroidales bacterium]